MQPDALAIEPVVANELAVGKQHGDAVAVFTGQGGILIDVDDADPGGLGGTEHLGQLGQQLLAQAAFRPAQNGPLDHEPSAAAVAE